MSTRTRNVRSRSGLPRRRALAPLSAAIAVGLAAGTAGLAAASASTQAHVAVSWSSATSAAAGGGISALVKAAKAEGKLNVIALPSSWADYGKEISTFAKKYGIKVISEAPRDSSARRSTRSRPRAAELGAGCRRPRPDRRARQHSLLARYKVATWTDIPKAQKDPRGDGTTTTADTSRSAAI